MRSIARRLWLTTCLAALASVVVPATAGARPTTAPPAAPGATVSGTVTGPGHRAGLYGMRVQAEPTASPCPTGTVCGPQAISGPGGRYTLSGLSAGTYTIDVVDGSTTLHLAALTITDPTGARTLNLTLPAPSVPAGTVAHHAARDLAWLNAERSRDGLGAGIVLNPRWSAECAAHDTYERVNHVLDPSENPTATDASAGGAWAGLNGVLAQDHWTPSATPWENAPIHLLALLAPSLSVVGIDDSGGLQCATTGPGTLRTPPRSDGISTYPAAGATGVDPSELARESPFTPVQFAGLPAAQPTGPELFVYLDRAGQTGQAPVDIVRATLTQGGRPVAVRSVDSTTRTLGPYLAGGIVIPVSPLRAQSRYRASVTVRDGSRTLTRAWSFTTA